MSLSLQANPTESARAERRDDFQPDAQPESRVFIELRTDAAFRLVIGRPSTDRKPAIIGLFGFADLLRGIWDAAKNGDPYARWWLLKVEAGIARAKTLIQEELRSVRKTLSACTSLGIDLCRGKPPRRVDLMFACPYAYYGARLVKQLDALITELDTSVQIGILRKPDTTRSRRCCERAVRHTFATSQGFWSFGVTDELLKHRDPKAVDAKAKMGAIPKEILDGERWPALLQQHAVTPLNSSSADDS